MSRWCDHYACWLGACWPSGGRGSDCFQYTSSHSKSASRRHLCCFRTKARNGLHGSAHSLNMASSSVECSRPAPIGIKLYTLYPSRFTPHQVTGHLNISYRTRASDTYRTTRGDGPSAQLHRPRRYRRRTFKVATLFPAAEQAAERRARGRPRPRIFVERTDSRSRFWSSTAPGVGSRSRAGSSMPARPPTRRRSWGSARRYRLHQRHRRRRSQAPLRTDACCRRQKEVSC